KRRNSSLDMSLRLSHTVLLLLLLLRTAEGGHNRSEVVTGAWNASVQESSSHMVVKEGSSALIQCNVTGVHGDVKWFNSRGALLDEEAGEKWQIPEKGILNITAVSFEDRGRYTCVASSGAGVTTNYTVTLRVAYTDSGLGLYFVIVCLAAFAVTMVLNVARLFGKLFWKNEKKKNPLKTIPCALTPSPWKRGEVKAFENADSK
uniref:Microfibril-associated glycoprotein 3 n=1 Tax=Salarias fasciatus TaxID=181472 RepID=A0A672GFG3_SALFA